MNPIAPETPENILNEIESDAYLDNVVWAALSGKHAEIAERNAAALRYLPELAPFGAAEDYSEHGVAQIAGMLKSDERLTLFTKDKPLVPSQYRVVREATVIQMVAGKQFARPDDSRIETLGTQDVVAMMELVRLTDPGPFKERTHEMGTFLGIRDRDQLIAMAGERMIAGRYVEVSAVCTHPNWRGRGLAKTLMEALSAGIQERGQIPFLHVFSTNEPAIRVYQQLGFRRARNLYVTAMTRAQPND
ncbi:GNAT family N-acetyltransferase [Paraburkholderia sp. BL25I1N1]|uniref:GNAT family N-acetyltransferase n=1 Tax=Paraburkholderia sp. BL25I1N1 TaxID=1938804 RepID=UPI000D06D1AC|nr:GNAT family N-acetyltransferase [Paraburkholderia sp. BL25I1N1]PRY05985.1 FR47-like protein [Paraburkholderia sp. BL25I1N1]